MKIGIILQARMSSTRLPGKVMKIIAGKPMLWHIIHRLKRIKNANQLIIATTNNPKDQVIINFALKHGLNYFVGSENDVLNRHYQTAKEFKLDHIVRATADNPLVDPQEAEKLIKLHLREEADYSSNKTEDFASGLPRGVGLEIFSFSSFEKSWQDGKKLHHREHVNEYILENPEKFKISILKVPKKKTAPHLELTVDTPEDLKKIRYIYQKLYKNGEIIKVEDVIKLMRKA